MSKASTLVLSPFSHPAQMIWIKSTSASVGEYCLIPPSQWECKKSKKMVYTWRQLLIIFSISLSIVLSSTIGQKAFSMLQLVLLGLGMIIDVNFLKCIGQYLKLIHILAILTILAAHLGSLRIDFKQHHDIWSDPGVELLLHLIRALHSSATKKDSHWMVGIFGISLRMLGFMGLF